LLSDDLGMKALSGDFASKARDSLAAGCDIALHCSGDMAEMQQVAEGLSPMGRETARRLEKAHALLHPAESLDRPAAEAERDRLLGLLND
ncbi:MAG: beta-hexosaminidase, partial [Alphaproteobacteria bacterium]|nr:beta-hexosaminidase [Alphaproteobacteria bacterium]